MFPESIIASHTLNLNILGVLISDHMYYAKYIASKQKEALKLLPRMQEVVITDTHVTFTLLCVHGSF